LMGDPLLWQGFVVGCSLWCCRFSQCVKFWSQGDSASVDILSSQTQCEWHHTSQHNQEVLP
jgi:hypothetical protein